MAASREGRTAVRTLTEPAGQEVSAISQIPGHDREPRIVVRQKQARSKIEAENRGADNGDKRKPSRPARRCESALSICPHFRSPRGLPSELHAISPGMPIAAA